MTKFDTIIREINKTEKLLKLKSSRFHVYFCYNIYNKELEFFSDYFQKNKGRFSDLIINFKTDDPQEILNVLKSVKQNVTAELHYPISDSGVTKRVTDVNQITSDFVEKLVNLNKYKKSVTADCSTLRKSTYSQTELITIIVINRLI